MPAFTEEQADITGMRKRRGKIDLFIGMICIIIGAAFGVFITSGVKPLALAVWI